jgi:hypothetical protein
LLGASTENFQRMPLVECASFNSQHNLERKGSAITLLMESTRDFFIDTQISYFICDQRKTENGQRQLIRK